MILHNPQFPSAGLLKRLLAAVYDWMLVLAIMMLASVPLVAVRDDAIDPGNAYYQIALLGVASTFFVGFWSYNGQTLGMRAWRLQLVQTDGRPVRAGQCVFRFLCAIVAVAAAGLGFWWMLIDADRMTWHDRWSGTRIQVLPRTRPGISAHA